MKDTIYERWTNLHNDPNARKALPETLFNSWEKSCSLGIDAENSAPLLCSQKKFNIKKEKLVPLYNYANDVITTDSSSFEQSNFGIALFDETGCLLKLYGSEKFYSWASENKLEVKSIWDENQIGTNAVSLGLQLKKPVSVIGEEHFSKFATNLAVYFSPIVLEKYTKVTKGMFEYGGVAIVTTVDNKNDCFLFSVETIAKAIAVNFYWFDSMNLFIKSVDCYIIIDQTENRNKIVFINKQIFKFFNISFKDVYFRYLEEIIDPYPTNEEFWYIINNKINVQDIDMTLSIMKNTVNINFSARPFYEQGTHVSGVTLILNSRKRIKNLISKHTGNNATFTFSQIIGRNEKYINVLKQAESSAASTINVLLLGESGVGKDIIAQSIHNASIRKDNPFIAVNCASFPKDLISSELFGYEEGAFTGAKKGGTIGKFELAHTGTIFLDEIGDMPLDLQAVLLRVLEQKSFMKVGSTTVTNIDVRIIAATNKNLKEKIQKGEFREDLYYRLGIIRLNIPPLRKRKDDILLLAEYFIKKICTRINKPLVSLSPEAKNFFINYDWPGNVRELQNLLEAVLQIYDSPIIKYEHIANYIYDDTSLDKKVIKSISREDDSIEDEIYKEDSLDFTQIATNTPMPLTKESIIYALELNKYNKTETAKYLGVARNTLYLKLKKYDLL